MAIGSKTAEPVMMMEINTTPLIDVMLVLLIMFIITIPLQTHAVKVDVPQSVPKPATEINPLRNEIAIDRMGTVQWNTKPVSMVVLRQYLEQTQAMPSIPELHVRPTSDARYEVVDQVLAIARRANVTKMGFVDNDRYAGL